MIGGKSTRFGVDKGLYKFKDKPFISYQLETLSRFEYDIFLVANSKHQVEAYINKIDIEKIMAFIVDDYDIVIDSKIRSPMLGLYSAFKELNQLNYQKAFVLSCDNPLIQSEVIKYMIKKSHDYDCFIPRWNNEFLEPLFAIYPIEKAFKMSSKNIKKNQYKLTNILDRDWKIGYASVEEEIKKNDPNLLSFKNINKPEDIKILEIFSD